MTLSDTHLVALSAAATREDHLLPRPERLFGTALGKVAARLTRAGLAEELAVTPDQPHWRVVEGGVPLGLRITAAGMATLGIVDEAAAPSGEKAATPGGTSPSQQPRPRSKRAAIIDLLRREDGASVAELQDATGWLPHTVRAALTSLRKAGHALGKARDEAGRTRYQLEEPAAGAGESDGVA